jgi:PAS domain S-box-containing protein
MYSVLYVDDEPDLLELGKAFLEESGNFSVTTLGSATEALAHLKKERFDAIVSDYQMPEMDGITFLRHLRTRGDETPFIIFTGKGREEVVIEALNQGADFYLQKGGDPTAQFVELTHKISHAISRRRAIHALTRSERDFRHLIEHASEAIYVVQDQMLRMVNPRLAEMTGNTEQELLTLPFETFIHPDDRAMVLDRYWRRQQQEAVPSRYLFRLYRKDRTFRWVELSAVIISWDNRPATLVFLIDVHDRKQTEDALRESEERYHQFFRTTLDCLFITTPEGTWIDCNDALVETLGYTSRQEILKVPVASVYANPGEREAFLHRVEELGYIKEHPLQFRRRDGTVFDALMTIVPLKNPDGSVKAFIGTVHNITEKKRIETALRESETRYRHIFESFEDLYYETDTNGIITILSPSLFKLTGWTPEDLIGKPATFLYDNPDERTRLLNRIAQEGFVRDYELVLGKRDGTKSMVSLSARYIRHADGSPAGIAGILRDITDRKLMENSLRESEEKFRSIVEYSLEAIMILDFLGNVIFANAAAARTLEIEAVSRMMGKNVMEFIAPDSREEVLHDFAEVARGHDSYIARYHVISARGNHLFIESIGKVISYGGQPADLVSIRNVSEHVRAEAEIRTAKEKLELIFNTSPDIAIIARLDDHGITAVNERFTTITGYTRKEAIGKTATGLGLWKNPMDREHFIAALKEKGTSYDYESVFRKKDGQEFPGQISAKITTLDGVPHVFTLTRDITAGKQAEEALRQANRKLNLLSGITRHDINNQLTILRGFLSLLEKNETDPKLADYLRKIDTSSLRISAMIQFTRDYEAIGVTAPAWQDIRGMVSAAAQQAPTGKICLENEIPDGIEVFADPLIARVFYNLIDNAIRYGGTITTIQFSMERKKEEYVIICKDDGAGIVTEEKEKIFDRGYGKNTGLGLSLSREILDITGISIRETGVFGKGARFEITVPKEAYRNPGNK